MQHSSRCCGLRLEITSLGIPRFPFLLQRLDDPVEDQDHVFFHIENDQAELEQKKLEEAYMLGLIT